MEEIWIVLVIAVSVTVLFLAGIPVIFYKTFYSPKRKPVRDDEYPTPDGVIYDPHRAQMEEWVKESRARKHTDVSVTSFDGLTLRGKYYEFEKGAPLEILFHGYRGSAERDLSGGVYRCFQLGHNALIVDHRGSGRSDGNVITFGAKESRDCLTWVEYTIQSIDPNVRIILTGISMGAATVLTAASMPLPTNVIGILADCGYTSTQEIIKKVMRDMRLPANALYPIVRIGAILFGRFDPDASSPIQSVKQCHLPVIFFHGDTDDFVPCQMSRENYAACTSEYKRLVITPGAGHGLCFPADQETYLKELDDFFAPLL